MRNKLFWFLILAAFLIKLSLIFMNTSTGLFFNNDSVRQCFSFSCGGYLPLGDIFLIPVGVYFLLQEKWLK
jgi:hypothetical protein